ncbi:MAG TPA: hypothetical protein VMS96_05075 [Terriglobales bacterium]|nr:hypothetical protein [Terriglobales bacterium]
MKRLLCVLCVLCGLSFSSYALDRHAFTFTDYNLTVTLTPASSGFEVAGKITLRNDSSEPQKLAVLQISSSLDWKSVTVAGKPVQYVSQPYSSDIDHTGALTEAIVTLPVPVAPSATVELQVVYAGTITQDATRLTRIGVPEKTALASDWDRIGEPFSAVRGVGYVTWYPISTEAASLTFENQLFDEIGAWKRREIESQMQMHLALKNVSGEVVPNVSSVWQCFHPDSAPTPSGCIWHQRDDWKSPAFTLGNYEGLSRAGLQIDYLAGRQPLAEDHARVITALTPFVTQWFGEPKQPIHIVELAWPDANPWESGALFLTPLKQVLSEPLQLQLVHQLTHTALPSPRPWIFEGVAQFAQALERERQAGRRAAIEFMEAQSALLVALQQPNLPDAPGRKDTTPPRRLEPLATTSDEIFYRLKAMRVWWMLRDLVGDAALQRALHNYKAQDDGEPSYLQRLLEAETQRKLEWFFDDWVYRDRGLPDFRIDAVYPRAILAGGYTLTITVENSGEAGAEVPVTVETAHGQITRRLEVRGRQKAVIRIEVPEAPRRVIVNDGSVPELDRTNNSFDVQIPAKQ